MANQEYRENLTEIRTMLGRCHEDEAARARDLAVEEKAAQLRPVLGGCQMAEGLAESKWLHGGRISSILNDRPELAGNLPIGPSMAEDCQATGQSCFKCGQSLMMNDPVSQSRMGVIHSKCARDENMARRRGGKHNQNDY